MPMKTVTNAPRKTLSLMLTVCGTVSAADAMKLVLHAPEASLPVLCRASNVVTPLNVRVNSYDTPPDFDEDKEETMTRALAVKGVVWHTSAIRATITVDGEPFDVAKHCVASGYGDLDAMQTRYAPEVRQCMEVDARTRNVAVTYEGAAVSSAIGNFIWDSGLFLPGDAFKIQPVLKKVNVYGPGGHFVRHVDTPREHVLGTVVVVPGDGCTDSELRLHSTYHDGEFVAMKHGVAMFYSNVPHEVTPATGTRVSIVYDLVKDNKSVSRWVSSTTEAPLHERVIAPVTALTHPKYQDGLQSELEDISQDQDATVGVLCTDTYSYAEVEAGLLKSNDVAIRELMLAHGFTDLRLQPVAVHACMSAYEDEPDNGIEYTETELVVYRMDKDDLTRALLRQPPASDVRELTACVVLSLKDGCKEVRECGFSHSGGYTGNETTPTVECSRYWACVLVGHRSKTCAADKEKEEEKRGSEEDAFAAYLDALKRQKSTLLYAGGAEALGPAFG